jgi:Zn-dependent M32 family carboxypeptidase
MLILDAALPPGAPWWVAALAALTASPGVAAIVVAWLQSRVKKETPDLKAITDRIVAAEEKLAAIAGTDSKALTVVKEDLDALAQDTVVKEDLDALAQDVAKLRDAVERRWKADDARRGRAGELAQQDRKELHDALALLRERVAGMAGRLEGLMERSHGR